MDINYKEYSYSDLKEVLNSIDSAKYPDRYLKIKEEIVLREKNPETEKDYIEKNNSLFFLTLIICTILWILKIKNLSSNVIPQSLVYNVEFLLSPILGIYLGVLSIKKRQSCSSKILFWFSVLVSLGLFFYTLAIFLTLILGVAFFGLRA